MKPGEAVIEQWLTNVTASHNVKSQPMSPADSKTWASSTVEEPKKPHICGPIDYCQWCGWGDYKENMASTRKIVFCESGSNQ